ncbi:MAG TPA: S41 family peptidase [Thermomicrobiales bacterium]|nr:S41 family peptidase [Thermomicrobiales bacterium]
MRRLTVILALAGALAVLAACGDATSALTPLPRATQIAELTEVAGRLAATAAAPTPTTTPTAAPSPTARRATPAPGKSAFVPTADTPCRLAGDAEPLPEQTASVDTIEQAYRCLLLHYVDGARLDDRALLTGAWSAVATAGQGHFPADALAPPALTGDREADWRAFAARFGALTATGDRAADGTPLARIAVDGMAASLHDDHVAYLDPRQWQSFYPDEVGLAVFPSAGFEVALDAASGKFYLFAVFPNGPAARAGLRSGDVLERVGGHAVGRDADNRALYDLLVGLPGTGDTVEVTRPVNGQTLAVLIAVDEVEVPLIDIAVLPGNVGYLRLRYFSFDAGEEFDAALATLRRRGIRSLVIDVRENEGGSVDALIHIASHLTHTGPLAVTIQPDGSRVPQQSDLTVPLLNLPFAVLTDDGSASASEALAAIARDRGGRVIGTKTAGALGGARFYELADGSALEITEERVLGPDGETIDGVGVTPDEVVPFDPADFSSGDDPPRRRAMEDLAAH